MKKRPLLNAAVLLVAILLGPDSHAQDDNPFNLPKGVLARLGKGRIGVGMAYSPDGTRLAVASNLGIWLYDAHTGTEVALLAPHTGRVHSVAFSPDGPDPRQCRL